MAKTMPLHELVENVCDRGTFIAFVRALAADRKDEVRKEELSPSNPLGPGANGRQDTTTEAFLEASAAWAEAVSEQDDERRAWFPEAPSWQAFARFLYAGMIYE